MERGNENRGYNSYSRPDFKRGKRLNFMLTELPNIFPCKTNETRERESEKISGIPEGKWGMRVNKLDDEKRGRNKWRDLFQEGTELKLREERKHPS